MRGRRAGRHTTRHVIQPQAKGRREDAGRTTAGGVLPRNRLRPPLRSVSHSNADKTDLWRAMRAEAEAALIEAPLYAGIIQATVLDRPSLIHAFAHRLGDGDLARLSTRDLCLSACPASPPTSTTCSKTRKGAWPR